MKRSPATAGRWRWRRTLPKLTITSALRWAATVRWMTVAILLFATGLKFYPAVAGIILLFPSRSRREILWQVGVFAGLLILLLCDQAESIRRYLTGHTQPDGFFTFGAGISAQLLSAPEWITTRGARTERRTIPPETITPGHTIDPIAVPVRPGS